MKKGLSLKCNMEINKLVGVGHNKDISIQIFLINKQRVSSQGKSGFYG